MLTKGLLLGFWVWSACVTLVGGVGAGLSCEGGDNCRYGFPSWVQPWTWGDYYVYPEALYVALAGLAAACAFVAFVLANHRRLATATFLLSLLLLSYPYFAAGADVSGRAIVVFGALGLIGPFLGVMALAWMPSRATPHELTGTS